MDYDEPNLRVDSTGTTRPRTSQGNLNSYFEERVTVSKKFIVDNVLGRTADTSRCKKRIL